MTLTLRTDGFERKGFVTVTPPPPVNPAGPAGPGLLIEAVALEGDDLVVCTNGDADGLRLVGHGLDLAGRPGARRAALRHERGPVRPSVRLPSGRYTLYPDGVRTAAGLWDALPVEVVGRWHRRVLRDRVVTALHLGPLIRTTRSAPTAGAVRRAYADTRAPTRPDTFYFDSYAGRSATDSPLAIFTGDRPATRIRALWGVQDHGQWVPRSRPSAVRSRERADAPASARVLVTNTELEEWYVNRPDQLVLQTFHGYLLQGHGGSSGGPGSCRPPGPDDEGRSGHRDLILTPTPEMTRHYREQYTGPAHEHGYRATTR